MSTHGVIAFATKVGTGNRLKWEGRLHSSDAYPSGLGAALWEQFREQLSHIGPYPFFTAREYLYTDHPAGFSTILGADWSFPCGYSNDYTGNYEKLPDGRADFTKPLPHGARCYCHGDRAEEEYRITDDDPAHYPWLYVFVNLEYTIELRVFMSEDAESAEGVTIPVWREIARIDLADNKEPDWDRIECGEKYERCHHYASYHFPELKGTSMERLGMDTFLGVAPLGMHDICGVQIGERRFTCSSSGCTGNDGRGQTVWIACGVKSEDGWVTNGMLHRKYTNFSTYFGSSGHYYNDNRFDVIIAKVSKKTRGYVPYPGVTFLYPPTCKEPIRMFAELRQRFQTQDSKVTQENSALAGMFSVGRLFLQAEQSVQ